MKMDIPDLDKHIAKYIQGGFGQADMTVMKEEAEKLKPGGVYVEIGVDEGRSARVFHEYAPDGVYGLFIDITDHVSDMMKIIAKYESIPFINLLFIDGHHDYDSVKNNTLQWENFVKMGGVILFHDYDHLETKRWLDEHYGDNKEVLHN